MITSSIKPEAAVSKPVLAIIPYLLILFVCRYLLISCRIKLKFLFFILIAKSLGLAIVLIPLFINQVSCIL